MLLSLFDDVNIYNTRWVVNKNVPYKIDKSTWQQWSRQL